MKILRGFSEDALFVTFSTGRQQVAALPHERTLLRTETGWAPEPVWAFWRKEKSLPFPSRYPNPGYPGSYSRHNTITNYAITTVAVL